MTDLARVLYVALVPAAAGTGLVGLVGWTFRVPRLRLVVSAAAAAVTVLAAAAWTLRFVAAGHLPLFGTYESALSLATAVLVVALVADRRLGRERADLLPPMLLVAAGLLLHGLGYDARPFALTISERSLWVDVHALFAWAAFAALAANAALGVRLLTLREPSPRLDRGLASTLSLGFLLHSGMMASGSFYKFLLFGKAWSFDPIELLGFVAWIAYGTLLHMHLFARWEGRRLAAWSVGLFVLLVVSYRAIVYFPGWATYHVFDMNLRLHLPR